MDGNMATIAGVAFGVSFLQVGFLNYIDNFQPLKWFYKTSLTNNVSYYKTWTWMGCKNHVILVKVYNNFRCLVPYSLAAWPRTSTNQNMNKLPRWLSSKIVTLPDDRATQWPDSIVIMLMNSKEVFKLNFFINILVIWCST